jgi:hypothetical protein
MADTQLRVESLDLARRNAASHLDRLVRRRAPLTTRPRGNRSALESFNGLSLREFAQVYSKKNAEEEAQTLQNYKVIRKDIDPLWRDRVVLSYKG